MGCPSIRSSLRATNRSVARRARRSLPRAKTRAPAAGADSTRKSAASISISTERSRSRWLTVDKNLFKDGAFIADPFRAWAEGDDPATVRYTHIPLAVFLANREAVLSNPHPNGLLVLPRRPGRRRGGRSRALCLDRHQLSGLHRWAWLYQRAAVDRALQIPGRNAGDRRRAEGPDPADAPLRHQRVRGDAIRATRKALETGHLPTVNLFYQPVGVTEVPVGTRPFLRRQGIRDGDGARAPSHSRERESVRDTTEIPASRDDL